MADTTYTIIWGHSGTAGREWTTALEASRYAGVEWGTVTARDPEAAVDQVRREFAAAGIAIGDWAECDGDIHILIIPEAARQEDPESRWQRELREQSARDHAQITRMRDAILDERKRDDE